jgi:hypothetical protein
MVQRVKLISVVVLAATFAVSACGRTPTDGSTVSASRASQATQVADSAATTTQQESTASTAESDTTANRGGVLIGSGH